MNFALKKTIGCDVYPSNLRVQDSESCHSVEINENNAIEERALSESFGNEIDPANLTNPCTLKLKSSEF